MPFGNGTIEKLWFTCSVQISDFFWSGLVTTDCRNKINELAGKLI